MRERTRGRIAIAFGTSFAAIVPLSMVALVAGQVSISNVKELLFFLIPLAWAAMAFYFGRPNEIALVCRLGLTISATSRVQSHRRSAATA